MSYFNIYQPLNRNLYIRDSLNIAYFETYVWSKSTAPPTVGAVIVPSNIAFRRHLLLTLTTFIYLCSNETVIVKRKVRDVQQGTLDTASGSNSRVVSARARNNILNISQRIFDELTDIRTTLCTRVLPNVL